ncbi:MAG: transcriptional repressor [Hyphomicrobiales bacterium]
MLGVLQKTRKPLSAYGILNELEGSSIRAAVQVYRSLEKLIRQGRVHRIAGRNSYVRCEHPDHEHRPVFFVCKSCGTVTEFDLSNACGALKGVGPGYEVETINIELEGTCKACAAARAVAA